MLGPEAGTQPDRRLQLPVSSTTPVAELVVDACADAARRARGALISAHCLVGWEPAACPGRRLVAIPRSGYPLVPASITRRGIANTSVR